MSNPPEISRRRLLFVLAMALLGTVSTGFQLLQGERTPFTWGLFVAFVPMIGYTAWPLYLQRRNSAPTENEKTN